MKGETNKANFIVCGVYYNENIIKSNNQRSVKIEKPCMSLETMQSAFDSEVLTVRKSGDGLFVKVSSRPAQTM